METTQTVTEEQIRTSNRTRWHNDQPYWPVRGWPVMSF